MRTMVLACATAVLVCGVLPAAGGRDARPAVEAVAAKDARQEIETFNGRFLDAHLRMDTGAILGMWAEDGVSLLPETAPLIGKPAIANFLAGVTGQLKGWRMETMELDFQGIEVSGDWASEWAFEHQVVRPPDDKPVFDGRGKMLLVLHRDGDGGWRIKREMWNQGQKAGGK